MNYWNGAFEEDHTYVVYDAFGNIVNTVDGTPASFGPTPPVGGNHEIKAECPESCNDETEDFIVRVTVGTFPEEHSWEIYEGGAVSNTTLQVIVGLGSVAIFKSAVHFTTIPSK